MTKLRELAESEVTFEVLCLDEEIPVRGAFASGDDAADREDEARILRELERGNTWAWCCVKVRAVWCGFQGTDYLGGCSYDDEEDFKRCDYFGDMKAEALERLNLELALIAERLAPLQIDG
jgi:hypothetical protein